MTGKPEYWSHHRKEWLEWTDAEESRMRAYFERQYSMYSQVKMTDALLKEHKGLPMVFSGGVTSNTLIRERFTKNYGAVFAEGGLASDNAAGLAFLGTIK